MARALNLKSTVGLQEGGSATHGTSPAGTARAVAGLVLGVLLVGLGCGEVGNPVPSPATAGSDIEEGISGLTALPRPVTWTATASVNSSTANNAVDASATTVWTTGTTAANNQGTASHWLRIDMKSRRTFVALTLNASTATTNYPRSYTVQVSNDGTNWGSAVATATGNTAVLTTIAFAPQTAQYIRVTQNVTAGVTNFWSVFDVQVYGTALSRTGWTATASTTASTNVAQNAIDTNTTNRWSSATTPTNQWFQVDMKSPQTFNQIVLDAGTTTNDYPRTYSVFVSNDVMNWGTAVATGTGTTAFIVIPFASQRAQFIRIEATKATTWSIQELNVEGQPTVRTAQPRAGWAATSNSSGGSTGPALAVDGSTTTRWRTAAVQATDQYFQVDMLAPRAIEELRLDAGSATTEYPRAYKVQVSNDNVSWGTAPTVVTGTGTSAVTTITFPSRTARYVRVTLTGGSTSSWSIYDFNVYASALTRPGWVAKASVTGGSDVAARAIDGTASTRWTTGVAQANLQSFEVDMLTPQIFNQLTLDAVTSVGHDPKLPSVLVSSDGMNWGTPVAITTVTGATTSSPTQLATTITFATQTARFFKVALTGPASPAANWSIHELNVWRIVGLCESVTCTPPASADNCQTGMCNSATGTCTFTNVNEGGTCTDSNACTSGDRCVAGACLPTAGTTCAGREDITFYQSYKSASPIVDIAAATNTPTTTYPVVTGPGLFGLGMDASTSDDLNYATNFWATPTNINLAKPGSMSMWVKPNGQYTPARFLATFANNFQLTVADSQGIMAYLYSANAVEVVSVHSNTSADWWTDQQWHLIVVNWDRFGYAISVDAAPLITLAVPWKETNPAQLIPNNQIFSGGSGTGYVKDETLILNRPLSYAEIQWYYARRQDTPTTTNPAIAMFGPDDPGRHIATNVSFAPPNSQTLRVRVDLSGLLTDVGLAGVRLDVVKASDGSPVADTTIPPGPNMMAETDWAIPELVDYTYASSTNNYILKVTLTGTGTFANSFVNEYPFAYHPPQCEPIACKTPGVVSPVTGLCAYTNLDDWTPCANSNVCDGMEACHAGSCQPEPAGAATTCAGGTRVTFYQSFNSTTADLADSQSAPVLATPFAQAPGLFGQALDQSVFNELAYTTSPTDPEDASTNFVLSKPGSLSLWIKPPAGYSGSAEFFLGTSGGTKLFVFDAGWGVIATLERNDGANGERLQVYTNGPANWRTENRWHLVVVNWSQNGLSISVDGVWSPLGSATWLRTFPGWYPGGSSTIYASATWTGAANGTLKDELMILNRPMTADEVEWYYAQRDRPSTDLNPAIERFSTDSTSCNPADDLNPCTADSCDPVLGVVHALLSGVSCSDGFACTQIDMCVTGVCTSGPPVATDDNNACTADSCNPALGGDVHTPANEGGTCDDANANTSVHACRAGTCFGSNPPTTGSGTFAGLTDLEVIDGARRSGATAINTGGDVAGTEFQGNVRSVAWRFTAEPSPGALAPIGVSPADSAYAGWEATGINDSRTVVGVTQGEGFMAATGQNAQIITGGHGNGSAMGINAAGQIAASERYYIGAVDQRYVSAFRRNPDGTKYHVGQIQGSTAGGGTFSGQTVANGIAPNSTDLVGYAGLTELNRVFDAGTFDFVPPWGMREAYRFMDPYTGPADRHNLNDNATGGWDLLYEATATNGTYVVGWGVKDTRCRAFRYTVATNEVRDLGILDELQHPAADMCWTGGASPHFNYYTATSINSHNEIVGSISYGGAFYYNDAQGQMIDLQDLVDPALDVTLQSATGINASHEIVGSMTVAGDPQSRAYKMKLPDGLTNEWKVSPRVDGVANLGGGKYVAIFGYDSWATAPVQILPGDNTNAVRLNGGQPLSNPQPAPPTTFLPTQTPGTPQAYIGTFLPTFIADGTTNQTISWVLAGVTKNASVGGGVTVLEPHTVGTNGLAVDVPIGGGETTPVLIRPDMGDWSDPPADIAATNVPVGPEFDGTLTGTLTVSPSGASVYTVPISMPPGVAGMAPNLSLVYNSQGGDGLAGQGWELSGLSMIHRCPKTRVQDGHARPVVMDSLANGGNNTDGICLDGQRLFETSPGSGFYKPERPDFSTIQRIAAYFKVTTKSGEVRYYGWHDRTRVQVAAGVFDPSTQTASGSEVAVWALDTVVDDWGNFYEIHYDEDPVDFLSKGIRVRRIDYTGHISLDDDVEAVLPFHSIHFDYEPRPDVRWVRFGGSRLPRNSRLKAIRTDNGTYSLSYKDPDPLLPSRLREILYCDKQTPTPSCLDPLVFDWEGGGYGWVEQAEYQVPFSIDSDINGQVHHPDTQLADLNGDGRIDFILGTSYFLNSGTGIPARLSPSGTLPERLLRDNGTSNALLADVNGDGLPDLVTGTTVYMNPLRSGGGSWDASPGFNQPSRDFGRTDFPDRVADIDGDGRADLIRMTGNTWTTIYLTNSAGIGWNLTSDAYFLPWGANLRDFHFEDVNRDGMADFVANAVHDIGGSNYRNVFFNTGSIATGETFSESTVAPHYSREQVPPVPSHQTLWRLSSIPADSGADAPIDNRYLGDVDGDGLHDAITYSPHWGCHCESVGCQTPSLSAGWCLFCLDACNPGLIEVKAKVEFSTGVAFTAAGTGSYDTALRSYDTSLPPPAENYEGRKLGVAEPRVAFADINADGLVDMLRVSGNQLWINTGETWTALPDSYDLPVVPTRHGPNAQQSDVGATFVDLNSDGVVDIAQCTLDTVPWCRSWINQFRPAAIKAFPRAQAINTIATYEIITQPGLVGVGYEDFTSTLESGTTYGSIPLKVVTKLAEDNGIGGTFVTTYRYRDLRGSAFGRGSQGFRQILIVDPSGILTETTYSQRYPYSGLPTDIWRYSGGSLLSKTHTEYCDVLQPGPVHCSPGSPSHEGPFNFVYPRTVTDYTYLNPSSQGVLLTSSAGTITTTTSTEFDDSGNPRRTAVVAFSPQGEQHSKIIDAEYGVANSTERRMGKVTKSTVRTQSLIPLGAERVQTTQFEYRTFGANLSFALAKKKVEPGSSITNPDDHLELHTAYDYDQFGNLTTTITCDPTLGDCVPTSTNPAFRKTSTSYSVAAFTPPAGTGLVTSLPYGPNGSGRFPVKTTNALNQSEYFVYDPRFGTVQQQTGPNGISTCNEYNTLGRQTKTIARCRSDAPQTATTTFTLHRRETSDPAGVASVTVTRPPTGSVSWGYADVLGRTVQTVTRAFSGGFTKTQTVYDEKGRVKQVSKPGFVNSGPTYWTTSEYDPIGRAWRVTEDLGFIDWGIDKKRITTSSFSGLGTTTEVSVTEGGTHSRYEEKNVLGKVSKVVDAYGTVMTFAYDADGNLTEAKEVASGNKVEMTYDTLGRKLSTRDPDLGWWHYTYTVYGELETQLDGRNQDTTMVYDKLGRMIRKIDYTGETAEWVYDVAPGAGIGKLAAMISVPDGRLTATCSILNTSLTTGKRTGKSFTYTEWGDVLEASECVNNEFFKTDYAYDAFGRQSLVRYPSVRGSRLGVQYHYTQAGFLHYLTEEADDSLYWKAVAVNAAGQVTREQTRNGVETSRTINDATGWLRNSNSVAHADSDRMIQSWAYNYDEVGNLKYRGRLDAVNAVNSVEDFQYDQLDRLTSSSVRGQGFDVAESYTYDSGNLGNLKTKNGKTYTYGTCNAGPHAVCSVDGGSAFTYDGNGSVLTGSGREFTYNAANRTSHITAGGTNVAFVYSADGNRVVQRISPVGGPLLAETIYVGLGGTGKGLYEKTTKGNTIEHVQFIYAGGSHGGNAFALRVVTEDVPANEAMTAMKYHSFDHLGSVTAVSDEFGHVVDATWSGAGAAGVMGYDAWGARRDPVGRSGTTSFELPVGHREFTGHETIPNIGVINMNGRMYDPSLGRFLSADPNVQFSADLQSYNRYSYVLNNPLRYTDPTGYFINGYFDFAVQVAITATSIAVCAGSSGVGCGFAFAVLATVYNTTSMVNSGAAWGDAIVFGGFSLAAGSYGGTIGGAIGGGIARGGSPFAGHLIGGVVGGLVSSGIMAGMTGQSLSAKDLLAGAAQSAFWSGVGWAVASQRQLSQASVEEAQGGGGTQTSQTGGDEFQTDGIYDESEYKSLMAERRAANSNPVIDQAAQEGLACGPATPLCAAIAQRVGPIAARAAGQFGQRFVEGMKGMAENTSRIVVGGLRLRVPDLLNEAASYIGEVKNVARLSLTSQLRDFISHAVQNKMTFELFVRIGDGTRLSVPLQKAQSAGLVNIYQVIPK